MCYFDMREGGLVGVSVMVIVVCRQFFNIGNSCKMKQQNRENEMSTCNAVVLGYVGSTETRETLNISLQPNLVFCFTVDLYKVRCSYLVYIFLGSRTLTPCDLGPVAPVNPTGGMMFHEHILIFATFLSEINPTIRKRDPSTERLMI